MPARRDNRLLWENRSVAFVNTSSWIDFMKDMDFSYGCNIHGNIAAYLSGVPGLVLARDLRVAELANYFEMPMLGKDDIENKVSVIKAYERADFSKVRVNHAERFAHYVDFLDANGLDHIFKADGNPENTPYDRRIRKTNQEPAVYTRVPLTLAQMADSMPIYSRAARHYWKKYKNKLKARLKQ